MAAHTVKESEGFGFLVRDVARLILRRFESRAKNSGLTQSQWLVIGYLVRCEGVNQATLADLMDIEPITLVGLLDKLEQAGLVERRRDPNDRRARLLYLTAQAQTLLKKMDSVKIQVREEAFAGVPAHQQKQLMQLLHHVRSNLTAGK